ncbi:hypothetical protein [Hyalangium sp.]|uniref:hypothetical protein n=1 Tax=Hyalangium sp. TaxID=2028555 RepID=UPI002D715637|nr:hypothetical protein [Hyalangium sp.]HYH96339.1 hypothetical protein [Hyalangium sp.]
MTDITAVAVPLSHVDATIEHPSLKALGFVQLKSLRSISRSLRSLGFLWAFSGIVTVVFGGTLIGDPGRDNELGLVLVPYGLAVALLGPYSAWARPAWGRTVCMLLSVPPLASIPYGTLLGILSLVALGRAKPLFGADGIPHKQVEAEYQARKP